MKAYTTGARTLRTTPERRVFPCTASLELFSLLFRSSSFLFRFFFRSPLRSPFSFSGRHVRRAKTAVGNTIHNYKVSKRFVCLLTRANDDGVDPRKLSTSAPIARTAQRSTRKNSISRKKIARSNAKLTGRAPRGASSFAEGARSFAKDRWNALQKREKTRN